MDLRRLELFAGVVEHGGFTAAGRALHVAQPSISLAIRELETEVGATLLVRGRQGVRLTPAGEALLGPARRALREVANAGAAVAAVQGLVAGRLDVAALPTLAADPLARMIGRFVAAHTAVEVRLHAPADPRTLAEAVRTGEAEIGVTEGGRDVRGLEETSLGDQELLAVTSPGEAAPGPLELTALAGRPVVLTPPGTSLREVVEDGFAAAGVTPLVAAETEQRDALLPLTLAGVGTTFLPPALAAAAAAGGGVVRRTRPALRRSLALVRRAGPASPAVARFYELNAPREVRASSVGHARLGGIPASLPPA
jgi:LysR family carnitine catabolism transcriptional activator